MISFHQLHDKCDTRIKELRWCPHCDKEVEWKHIVKGYEYAKNRYVEVSAEDLEKLPLPSKQTIEVASFVNADDLDAIFYDTSYFIEVGKQAAKPYRLLLNTLKDKNKIGIAKVALRTRERVCALRPMGDELILQTLYYADEIKPMDEYAEKQSIAVSPQERKMANALVDALSSKFEPEKFHDSYEDALGKLIKAKLKGVEIKPESEAASSENGLDLMDALKASVENLSKAHVKKAEMETSARVDKSAKIESSARDDKKAKIKTTVRGKRKARTPAADVRTKSKAARAGRTGSRKKIA